MIVNEISDGAGRVLHRESVDVDKRTVTVDVVGGDPVVRPMTAEEAVFYVGRTNEDSVERRLRDALTANKQYLALATPTAAQTRAQVDALTRQMSGLIRRELHDFGDTD